MIQRRNFLAGILAAGVAPAFVESKILMPVKTLILPEDPWITDDGGFHWVNGRTIVTDIGLTEIITRVLRERQPQILQNIEHNNTFYRQMAKGRK